MRRLIALVVALTIAIPTVAESKVIRYDRGGDVIEYLGKIKRVPDGEQVQIVGYCASACTLYLSKPNVCISKNTKLMFHSALVDAPILSMEERRAATRMWNRYMMNKYPEWARQIINKRGGLTRKEINLTYKDLAPHLPLCA